MGSKGDRMGAPVPRIGAEVASVGEFGVPVLPDGIGVESLLPVGVPVREPLVGFPVISD